MTATPAPSAQPWVYASWRERSATATYAALSLGVLSLGLMPFFAPWAVAAAAGYGICKTIPDLSRTFLPILRQRALNKIAAATEELDDSVSVTRMARDFGKAMGLKTPPRVFLADEAYVAKVLFPLGTRGIMKKPGAARDKIMAKVFAANPQLNAVMVTRQGLARLDERQMKFIIAHEMAHIRTDKTSMISIASRLIRSSGNALIAITAATLALGVAGVAVPAVMTASAFISICAFVGFSSAAKVINNTGQRIKERRADRNAVHLTGDCEGAILALEALHDMPLGFARRTSLWDEANSTHPGQVRRSESLRKFFNASSTPTETAQHKPPAKTRRKKEASFFLED